MEKFFEYIEKNENLVYNGVWYSFIRHFALK